MPSAIPYIRFSSKKQAKGSSLKRQESMITDWLLRNTEYTLSTLRFEDLGRSGYHGDHLEYGFGKLLAAIEAGAIKSGDSVVIEAMDRAGRLPPLEMVSLISRILSAGVSIVTLDDQMTYTQESANGQHLFLLVAKMQQANQYSEALSRRIKGSYADRRTKAAAGVSVKRSTPVWLDKEGNLVESLAPFIVQAFEDYSIGLGERRIYDRIHDKHTLLEKLNPSTIKRWMTNNTAIGYWGDIPDAHPAVISPELWYRVQKRIQEAPSIPKAAPSKHLLTGLVKCSHCQSNMIYKALKHSPHVMACGKRARFGVTGCDNKTCLPVQLIDYIRRDSSFSYLESALAGQQLSQNEKDLLVVKGKIEAFGLQITTVVNALTITGDIPELQGKLIDLSSQRKALEEEAIILSRTDSPSIHTPITLATLELGMLENDPLKLNTLLQSSGFVLWCNVDGEIAVGVGSDYFYKYLRVVDGRYVFALLRDYNDLHPNIMSLKIVSKGDKTTTTLPQPLALLDAAAYEEAGSMAELLSLLRLHSLRSNRVHFD
jgi:DNA invertase Pin-like site-specific DNA recombinase